MNGGREGIRTPDPRVKSPLLCLAELRAPHHFSRLDDAPNINGNTNSRSTSPSRPDLSSISLIKKSYSNSIQSKSSRGKTLVGRVIEIKAAMTQLITMSFLCCSSSDFSTAFRTEKASRREWITT